MGSPPARRCQARFRRDSCKSKAVGTPIRRTGPPRIQRPHGGQLLPTVAILGTVIDFVAHGMNSLHVQPAQGGLDQVFHMQKRQPCIGMAKPGQPATQQCRQYRLQFAVAWPIDGRRPENADGHVGGRLEGSDFGIELGLGVPRQVRAPGSQRRKQQKRSQPAALAACTRRRVPSTLQR